jgi:hypothetical protein
MDFELPEIKINSFKEADTAINKFKKLIKKKDITHDYIKNEFFNHFGAFFILCKHYESEFFDYIPIYRARPAKKIKNVEDIRQYGAPPIDELCGDGRANLDGRNVFYGSSNPLGALIETKQVYSGEEFYVGKWVFNKEKYGKTKIAISSYLNYNKKNKRDWEDILAITKEDKINELKKFYGNEKAHIIHYLIDKLSQFFLINSNSYYKLTGFLADQMVSFP